MLKVRGAAPGCCCCGRPLCSAAVPPAPASTHVPLPRCRCFWVAQEAATLARVAAKYETDLKKVQDALNAAMESGAVVCATPLPGLVRRRRGGPGRAGLGSGERAGGQDELAGLLGLGPAGKLQMG